MTTTTAFGPNPGGLRMLSYVPAELASGAPLVVVLHGCTQRAEAYAVSGGWLTLADRYRFAVLAPEQSMANNPNRCFNWFEPGDTRRDGGEAASIRSMVAHMVRAHALDPRRVFVAGLSAGGAMTAVMLATYPDVFAAGAVIAGLPYGVAGNVKEALGAMHGGQGRSGAELAAALRRAAPAGSAIPRLAIWHGAADATVRPSNASDLAAQWAAAHDLAPQPDRIDRLPGRTRSVWLSPQTGEVLIESHLIEGLGHGAPLSTLGDDTLGSVAPYMLEAGVSSSLEIVRFWGLPSPETASRVIELGTPLSEAPPSPRTTNSHTAPAPARLGEAVMASLAGHVSAGVQDTVARALRSAGLMV